MKRWHKVAIGIVVVLMVFTALGFLARIELRNFFYPVAHAMPAVVSEPMPEILARLETVLKTRAPQVASGLQPGLSDGDISRLEQQYNVHLPDDIKAIYQWHDGSAETTNRWGGEFMPTYHFLPLEEALAEHAMESTGASTLSQRMAYQIFAGHRATWICLFSDGAGDGYWFDPKCKPDEGAVFYNFNETGTFEFFPSAKNLMAGVVKCYEQGAFHIKPGSSPPELEEDFKQTLKLWDEFGAGN